MKVKHSPRPAAPTSIPFKGGRTRESP
jgi:hypothetical protein